MKETIYNTKNKTIYFIKKYKSLYQNDLDFSEFEYISATTKTIVITKYGRCMTKPSKLLEGSIPGIQTAVNKNEFFINQAKEKWGNKFNYNLSLYECMHSKIVIECPLHGKYEILPSNHLTSKAGCGKCGQVLTDNANKINPTGWSYSQWSNRAKNSSNFDNFKLYILECTDVETNEHFYKIGKTYVSIKDRIRSISRFPYSYKILCEYIGDSKNISILEKEMQKNNKNHLYIPYKHFDGKYECFNKLNNKTWNFIKKQNTLMEIST